MLSRNGINEKEVLKFNVQVRICSKNASVFASWCGCIVRKRMNAPVMMTVWNDIRKEPMDYEAKMCMLGAVSILTC